MILHAYAILDLKGGFYSSPFFMHTDAIAIRSFSDALADPQVEMAKHPEDYQLWRLGDFDDNAGTLTPLAAPQFLVSGLGETL